LIGLNILGPFGCRNELSALWTMYKHLLTYLLTQTRSAGGSVCETSRTSV